MFRHLSVQINKAAVAGQDFTAYVKEKFGAGAGNLGGDRRAQQLVQIMSGLLDQYAANPKLVKIKRLIAYCIQNLTDRALTICGVEQKPVIGFYEAKDNQYGQVENTPQTKMRFNMRYWAEPDDKAEIIKTVLHEAAHVIDTRRQYYIELPASARHTPMAASFAQLDQPYITMDEARRRVMRGRVPRIQITNETLKLQQAQPREAIAIEAERTGYQALRAAPPMAPSATPAIINIF